MDQVVASSESAGRSPGIGPRSGAVLVAVALTAWLGMLSVDRVLVDALREGGVMYARHLEMPAGRLLATVFACLFAQGGAIFAFVRHAQRNPRVGESARMRWGVAYVLAGPVALPLYWWRHVRVS